MEKQKQQPFVNWEALESLMWSMMPPPPKPPEGKKGKGPGKGIGGWDDQAAHYNRMIQMEAGYTLNQLNCFDTAPTDTVLDIGCGPGRITVPMAKRAKAVTALDASPKMLEFCQANAKAAGVDNVTPLLVDWEDEASVAKVKQHDIVIASRSPALGNIRKLSSLAKKYVVMVIWSNNSPCIPQITGELFKGTEDSKDKPPFPMPKRDRRLGNNLFYNKVYDAGYNPNLRIVDDGFTKTFKNREEAYADLWQLRRDVPEDKFPIFQKNADAFLTDNPDGTVTYLAETKSIVLWWKPEIETYERD